MTRIIAIDIGLDGAIVEVQNNPEGTGFRILSAEPMPCYQVRAGSNARDYDFEALASLLAPPVNGDLPFVYAEQASLFTAGKQALASLWQCQGAIRGICAAYGIPYESVGPSAWKARMKVSAVKGTSVAKAAQLLPQHADLFRPQRGVRTLLQAQGIAEATLIGIDGHRLGLGGRHG